MSDNTSTYSIRILTEAELTALSNTKKSLTEMGKEAIATGNITKMTAEEQAAALAKVHHAAHEAGISHKELHEGIRLASQAAGDALGPFGEMAHFLSNPYFLAISGAILAIKMLIDQHEALVENIRKNIQATREMREAFETNMRDAVNAADEAMATFHRTLNATGQDEDRVAKQMAANISIINAQAEATKSLASANRTLQEALLATRALTGQITGPQQAHDLERIRQQERAAQEQADHQRAADEITQKLRAAEEYDRQSATAKGKEEAAIRESARVSALVADADDQKKTRKAELDAANEARDKAQAEYTAGHTHAQGQRYGDAIRRQNQAQDEYNTATQKALDLTVKKADSDAEIERQAKLAESQKASAIAGFKDAQTEGALTAAKERGLPGLHATQDAGVRVKRVGELISKQQAGTMTDDEKFELQGATSAQTQSDVSLAIKEMAARFKTIQTNTKLNSGHITAEDAQTILHMLDFSAGMHERTLGLSTQNQARLEELYQKFAQMEGSIGYNRSSQ